MSHDIWVCVGVNQRFAVLNFIFDLKKIFNDKYMDAFIHTSDLVCLCLNLLVSFIIEWVVFIALSMLAIPFQEKENTHL